MLRDEVGPATLQELKVEAMHQIELEADAAQEAERQACPVGHMSKAPRQQEQQAWCNQDEGKPEEAVSPKNLNVARKNERNFQTQTNNSYDSG